MENTRWNRKIFSLLLEKARGERSWRQYADECDISYVQMRKLAMMTQQNPPRPKLIRKLASHAFGDIDLEDFFFAAGTTLRESGTQPRAEGAPETVTEKYRRLIPKDRKTVLSFMDFLLEHSAADGDER